MPRLYPVLCLTVLVGCFADHPARPPAPDGSQDRAPVALTLRDPQGARYPVEAAPRDLTLTLSFADAPPAAPHVQLLTGTLHAPLVAGLSAARLAARTLPIDVTSAPPSLHVTARAALAPGGRYTLVWGAGDTLLAYPLVVSASPALGAAAVGAWPHDRAQAVPPNLARALLRFDGDVAEPDAALAAHVTLHDAAGAEVPSTFQRAPCGALGVPGETCAWRVPHAELAPGTHRLTLRAGLHGPTGGAIAPFDARFEVATAPDAEPPMLTPIPCEPGERDVLGACARVDAHGLSLRGRTHEPAEVAIAPGSCAALAGDGAFTIARCRADAATSLALRLRDLAGNERLLALALPPAEALAAVAIDELRIDPRGPEPAQEYVELLSSAPHPLSLKGFSLNIERSIERGSQRDRARTVVGDATLLPGARALLVGPDFDPADARDEPLAPGIALVRLDRALGLANEGVRAVLRDAAGRRLSTASAPAPLAQGQCSARLPGLAPAGDPDLFALDPDGGCTPGRATFESP